MKQMKTFLGFALVLCASSVFAQAGIYVTGGIGQGHAKFNGGDFPDEAGFDKSIDDKDTTWNIGVGYRFHRNIAVELGYAHLGEHKVRYTGTGAFAGEESTDDYEVTAWKLAAVGMFPVVQQLSIVGKLGLARTKVEDRFTETIAGVTTSETASKSKNRVFWGIGAQYDFTANIGARLEYESYGTVGSEIGADAGTGRAKISTFNLNLVYAF